MKHNTWVLVVTKRDYKDGNINSNLYEFPTRREARSIKVALKINPKVEKMQIFHKKEYHVGKDITYFLTAKS